MTYQHVQEVASLKGDLGQPLIGVIAEEQGHEVVRYFTEEQEADRVMVQNTTQDALALAGGLLDSSNGICTLRRNGRCLFHGTCPEGFLAVAKPGRVGRTLLFYLSVPRGCRRGRMERRSNGTAR